MEVNVGILGKIIPQLPCGAEHTTRAIVKTYSLFMTLSQGEDFRSAAKHTIRKTCDNIPKAELVDFLTNLSTRVGDLIIVSLYTKDPSFFTNENFNTTMSAIEKVLSIHCPTEIQSIDKVEFLLRSMDEKNSNYAAIMNIIEPISESFVFAFEEENVYAIERVTKYVTKTYLDRNTLSEFSKTLLEMVFEGEVLSATNHFMSIIRQHESAEPYLKQGFLAIIDGDMQLAYDNVVKAITIVKRNI